MVKLYLDEDMSSRVAQALRSKGFDVVSSHEVGNDGLSDEEQLHYATKEGRHLVTYNAKDFLALANQWYQRGRRFPKILNP
jgi:predicted nuclease of predicted toxin-antitoxin system